MNAPKKITKVRKKCSPFESIINPTTLAMQKQNYSFINKTKIKNFTLKVSVILLIASVTFCIVLYGLFRVNAWFDTHQFKFVAPIEFRKPVRIEKRQTLHINFQPFNTAKAQELTEAIKWTERGISPKGLSEKEKLIAEIFGKDAKIAIAIAKAESGINCESIGDEKLAYRQNNRVYGISYGAFQIRHLPGRPSPKNLLDCEFNFQYAKQIKDKSGWTPWSAYTNGKYKQYLTK
jgi:hypothetical protein